MCRLVVGLQNKSSLVVGLENGSSLVIGLKPGPASCCVGLWTQPGWMSGHGATEDLAHLAKQYCSEQPRESYSCFLQPNVLGPHWFVLIDVSFSQGGSLPVVS